MKKYGKLWNELNTLLSYLEGCNPDCSVVKLVNDHFAKYNNDAPGYLLQKQIELLQKRLDEAETGHEND